MPSMYAQWKERRNKRSNGPCGPSGRTAGEDDVLVPDGGSAPTTTIVGDPVTELLGQDVRADVEATTTASVAVAESPTVPVADAGTTDVSTLPESWIHELTTWDDEHHDVFASKVTEYLSGGRTRWWAERLAFCDVSDAVNGAPPDVPTDLNPLEIQAAELGQHVLVDGRFPESMRPRKGFGPPSPSRRINGFEVPGGWTLECWIERLLYMATACIHAKRAAELSVWADGLDAVSREINA